jgi:hypothetical protein
MFKALKLEGQTFGNLTVIERSENDKHGKSRWICKCCCGNEKIIGSAELKKGDTKSCGCIKALTCLIAHYSGLINKQKTQDYEDDNYILVHKVCNNKKNIICICKKCSYENSYRASRYQNFFNHKCIA